jgi:hypothetical protein
MSTYYGRTRYTIAKATELLVSEAQEIQKLPDDIKRETSLQQQAAALAQHLVGQCRTLDSGFVVESENLKLAFLNDSRSDDCYHIYQEYAVAEIIESSETSLTLRQCESFTIGPFAGETTVQAVKNLYDNILQVFDDPQGGAYFFRNQKDFKITILESSEE